MSMSHDVAVREVASQVRGEWARCRHWIEDALAYDGGLHTIEDIEGYIGQGQAHFWPGKESAVVTQFWNFPQKKALNYWLAGGDMDELLNEMQPVIEEWAKLQGCDMIVIAGRRGWERAMKRHGFDYYWTALGKKLGD